VARLSRQLQKFQLRRILLDKIFVMARDGIDFDCPAFRVTRDSDHKNNRARNDLTGMQTQDRKNQAPPALRSQTCKKNL
jgi:hypothetical protein